MKRKIKLKISFTKVVLPFIIPLTGMLTMKDSSRDFIEMLNIIKNNQELLEILDEQTYIWWNRLDIINIIKKLTEK